MAAAFVIARRRGMDAGRPQIGFWSCSTSLSRSAIPSISIGGHLGGLVGGGLAALVVTRPSAGQGRQGLSIEAGGLIVLALASVLGR